MHGGRGHRENTARPKKKPADDKAYKAAIERLPDKPYDAWRTMR